MDLAVCPYNATHHIPHEKEQLLVCPDRAIVELQKFRFNEPVPGQHGYLGTPLVYGSSFIPIEVRDMMDLRLKL